ncbi:MAG: PrsW family intramembrane metalloprotease, partial [Desulfomonilaceae bacterium]
MSELASIDWRGVLLVIGLAYAPGIFWLWYFYRKDIEPEPLRVIRNCFLAGMAVCIPAAILETPAKIGGTVFVISVACPILEECLKFGACYLIAYRRKEFKEPMDGVVCAVAVALGFASLENVFYLYGVPREGLGPLLTLTLIRSFFAVPGHALFAIMWGYALGRAKFTDHATGRRLILTGLGMAIAAHGLYNLMSLVDPFWAVGMMVFIPVAWGLAN